MSAPGKFDSWENDLETVAGRSSAENESETEAFLDQKSSFVAIQDMARTDEGDCPFCRRNPFWKKLSAWCRSSNRCKHGRRSIREYNENSRPIRKRRTSICTIILGFLTMLLALLYVPKLISHSRFTDSTVSAVYITSSQFSLALGRCYGIPISTNSFPIGENQDSPAKAYQDIRQTSHVIYCPYLVILTMTTGGAYLSFRPSTMVVPVWKRMYGCLARNC